MKRISIFLLRSVILLIAIVVLFGMVKFPQIEGRAANLDLINIYKDPLIIFVYIGSIPFFVLLYQAFKLVGYIEQNKTVSKLSERAVRNIKYCGLSLIGFVLIAILYIRVFVKGDDPAGPTGLGIFIILVFTVIVITASVFEKRIKKN